MQLFRSVVSAQLNSDRQFAMLIVTKRLWAEKIPNFEKRPGAGYNVSVGRIWHAGRRLPTLVLNYCNIDQPGNSSYFEKHFALLVLHYNSLSLSTETNIE